MTDIITGSWCSGSLRNQDLIPPFLEATRRVLEWSECRKDVDQDEREKAIRELEIIERRIPPDSSNEYFYIDDAAEDLAVLDTILKQFAPPGFYWGAHEGDNTNFGYWAV